MNLLFLPLIYEEREELYSRGAFLNFFSDKISKYFICSIGSPKHPEYVHKTLRKSYRRKKSYWTSKFSMMVIFNAMDRYTSDTSLMHVDVSEISCWWFFSIPNFKFLYSSIDISHYVHKSNKYNSYAMQKYASKFDWTHVGYCW